MRLKIAARKSDLARLQAYQVGEALKARYSEIELEYVFSSSLGDKNINDPLWKMPEKGVFTQDLHKGLLEGHHDVVVHSWKDLPLMDPEGPTQIAMTLQRADQRDVVLFRKDRLKACVESKKLQVFTSSPRRSYNLSSLLPNIMPFEVEAVEFLPVRGNIQTRVAKLMSEEIDALVVAKAALDRLIAAEKEEFSETRQFLKEALKSLKFMVLPLSANPTAAAQGALAVEVLKSNREMLDKLSLCDHAETRRAVESERERLRAHGGGCHAPMGFSFVTHKHGLIQFEKGKSHEGVDFGFVTLHPESSELPRFSSSQVYPFVAEGSGLFARKVLNVEKLPSQDLWVARANALDGFEPEEDRVIWCAGLQSWRRLALSGHWVSGCADQMGEAYSPEIDLLLGRAYKPLRLTHADAEAGEYQPLATYELEKKPIPEDMASKECFYWMSSTSFDYALEVMPEIATKWHCTGLGKTADHIRNKLGPEGKLAVFYSYANWKDKVKK